MGWNNNPTVLCPYFYAPDFSQPNGGNLTFVRDYSIGANSISVNFGDGSIGQTNNWHLYKKNGSYMYQGLPLTDTICYTVSNSGGTATNCVSINCYSPLPTITSSSLFLCAGDSVVLTATMGAVSYQWLHNNNLVSGATASTYVTTLAGKYQCLVTDACGIRYSNQLKVQNLFSSSAPVISTVVQGSICSNSTNFQLLVNQSLPQTNYLWMRDTVLFQTSTSNTSGLISPVSGNYYCILSNGCAVDTTNVLNIVVGQNPSAVISSNGQTTFCLGDSLQLSTTSCNGCSYQWKYGVTNVIGATDSIYYALQTGTYSCIFTDTASGCFSTSNYLSLTTTTYPIPNVTLTCNKPDTLCYPANNNTVLSVGTHYQGNNYIWRKNGINIIAPNTANYNLNVTTGTYDCIVSNLCGVDTSNSLSFFVEISQLPFISNSAGNYICVNDSAHLTVNPSTGFFYQWKNSNVPIQGATTSSYTTKSSGVYSCSLTGSLCSAISGNCYVTVVNKPPNNIIPSGPITFCSPNTVTLQSSYTLTATYQWLKNGILLNGSTLNSYIASTNGSYQVITTDIYGCDSISAPVTVSVPCRRTTESSRTTNTYESNSEFFLYPNPASQKLFLETNNFQSETVQLKIFDVLGKEILSKQLNNLEGSNTHEFNIEKLKPAVYFVEIKNGDNKSVFKVMKE
ncbi:MAG: T9SS type A sorting domain-containing protein [Bacteroidetes bacterium]|nr:T9SS type A sorting domain-containing protein [Bacteroidota bacterium]